MKKITFLFSALFVLAFGLQTYAQGTETFGNTSALNNVWGARTWTGDDGSTWTYSAGSKANSGAVRTGDMGILLNHAVDGSINVTSGTISGGIGNISVEYKNRYNTENDTHTIKIYVNDILVGEASDNSADQIKTLEVNNLNITGDFTIKVTNESAQGSDSDNDVIAIDNITWTAPNTADFYTAFYYHDFRYETNRGFVRHQVTTGGSPFSPSSNGRVDDLPDAGDTVPSTSFTRPANQIAETTDTRAQKAISIQGSPGNVNYETEQWIVLTAVDLTSANANIPANHDKRKVDFWTQQRYSNGTATFTVWYSTDYSGDVTTASWTELTNSVIGKLATPGQDAQKYVKGTLDLSTFDNETQFNLAFKYTGVAEATSPYSGSSRNGTIWISDVSFHSYQDGVASNKQFDLNSQAAVYPNPTSGIVNVDLDAELGEINSLTVYNATGSQIATTTANNIDLSNLVNGLYLIKIETSANQTIYKKVIKN